MDPDRPVVRWSLIVLWALVGLMLYQPAAAFFGWPLLVAAFAGGVIWTAQDFMAVRHQTEAIRESRWVVRIELLVMAALAGVVVVFAAMNSMREEGRVFALSTGFAPVLGAIVLVAALRAIRLPTPRRIAIASLVALGVMPVFAAIRIVHVPVLAARETDPSIILVYSVCSMAIGAIGVHLGIVARRIGYGDEIPAEPPRAVAVNFPPPA